MPHSRRPEKFDWLMSPRVTRLRCNVNPFEQVRFPIVHGKSLSNNTIKFDFGINVNTN